MLKKLFIFGFLLLNVTAFGQTNVKTMFYNILMFPEEQTAFDRPTILKNILDEYQPDIFMICELQSEEGADQILNLSLNADQDLYAAAPYLDNQSSGADLQNLVYYRKDKFTLEATDVIETEVRDINRYVLKLSTENGDLDPVIFDVYVTHLKSSQGGANEALRFDMVTEFTNYLETIDPNSNVLFAGDLNIYTSTEPAYIELLDETNAVVMVDPIDTPGAWNNNEDFAAVHTQSTRTSSGPFGTGAGGGMDDRFDFILMSQNMQTSPKLRYIPNTYKAYGNNGNCYNGSVNDATCAGEFGSDLRQNLWLMSDHLPVVMDFETDQELVILSGTDFDAEKENIKLKNNVVSQTLELILPYVNQNAMEIAIYNSLGQKVMNSMHNSSDKNLVLDVSSLSSGFYYLSTNRTASPLKFLKN